jgi:hypothetical protein
VAGFYLSEAQNPIPLHLHTVHVSTKYLFFYTGKGGGFEPERRGEGQ